MATFKPDPLTADRALASRAVARRATARLASLPGPENIVRRVFDNGTVGLAWENDSSPSVVVHGWIWTGSIDEPAGQAGLAGLTASMLTRGTERRTFSQIGEEIESLGAALSFGSSGHRTTFAAKCLVEDLPLVVDILADCLHHPTFPIEYVEKRRGEILTALQQREFNTTQMASLRFHELMYPDHPYGRSSLGYEDTIHSLTRENIEAFYTQTYGTQGARNAGVTIVGAIPTEQGLDLLENALGTWQGGKHVQAPLPPVEAVKATREVQTSIPGKTQSDIVLGWLGLTRQDPDFFPAYLANCILGQFGLMGRLGDYVRDEHGLAYYCTSRLDAGLGAGPWAAVAGVDPANLERTIEAILDQIKRIQQEPVGKDELKDNKAYLVGSMPLRLEAKEGIAAQIAHMEMHQLGLDYLRRFSDLIQAVTAEDIMAATQKHMNPDAYVVSVAGPPNAEPS
jgi:zinc protease